MALGHGHLIATALGSVLTRGRRRGARSEGLLRHAYQASFPDWNPDREGPGESPAKCITCKVSIAYHSREDPGPDLDTVTGVFFTSTAIVHHPV